MSQEILDIGRKCCINDCGRLDYLPFSCSSCSHIFCSDHFKDHKCLNKTQDNRAIKCMVCNEPIAIPNNEDPNIRIERHIQNNCQKTNTINVKSCFYCKKKVNITTTCKSCSLQLCLAHRHPMDHQCSPPKTFTQRLPKSKKCPVQ